MPFKNPQKLSFRINAAVWTVCAALLLLFGIFFYRFEQQQFQTHLDQSKVLLESVFHQKREMLANEIFANHRKALIRTLEEIKAVEGITAVHLFDADGHLTEWEGEGRRSDLDRDQRRQLIQGPLFNEIMFQDRAHLAFIGTIEVIGERQGYAELFFDLSEMKQTSRYRILLIILVYGGLLVVLSMVLHLLVTRLVIEPVSKIRDAMDRVMQGHLGEQVALEQNNEIGEVATAFNSMSEQLKEQRQRLLHSMSLRDSYAELLEETNRKLARLNTDLESIVDQRTRELRQSNEKLRNQIQERVRAEQARRALEERLSRSQKMEALGLLAGGVAHDLNNVLSGIVSFPELILLDMAADHDLRPIMETIHKSGQKAAAIVQDLLTLARRGVTHTDVLNLNSDIIEDYLNSPEFKKIHSFYPYISLETRLDPQLMNLRGSTVHLRKVIMNLVSNAAEAQPDGGHILITTENRYVDRPVSGYDQVNEGDYVVLRVEDQGTGIAPEDMNRIFEPFYTKKVMGRSGTGLGMAVVWGTVQDHHGYINVESEVGEGTIFELYFPVTRDSIETKEKVVPLDSYVGHGEKVLVIDDVPEQRKIASQLLLRLNYDVAVVESGEAALAYLASEKVDILVIDMIMDPGIDGLETYSKVIDLHPGQKAIIASGYAENERVREAQHLGAGAYVRKPYTIENIGMALRRELDRE